MIVLNETREAGLGVTVYTIRFQKKTPIVREDFRLDDEDAR